MGTDSRKEETRVGTNSQHEPKLIPMVQRLLGSTPNCEPIIEEGIAGDIPGSPPTYLALGHLYFESIDAFVQAWRPQAIEHTDLHHRNLSIDR